MYNKAFVPSFFLFSPFFLSFFPRFLQICPCTTFLDSCLCESLIYIYSWYLWLVYFCSLDFILDYIYHQSYKKNSDDCERFEEYISECMQKSHLLVNPDIKKVFVLIKNCWYMNYDWKISTLVDTVICMFMLWLWLALCPTYELLLVDMIFHWLDALMEKPVATAVTLSEAYSEKRLQYASI